MYLLRLVSLFIFIGVLTACERPLTLKPDGTPDFSQQWGATAGHQGEHCGQFNTVGTYIKQPFKVVLMPWKKVNNRCGAQACYNPSSQTIYLDNTDNYKTWDAYQHEWCHSQGFMMHGDEQVIKELNNAG